MYYKEDLGYVYPEKTDGHMITVKKIREVVLDENYPYLQKGFIFGCKRFVYFLGVNLIVFPLLRVTHGLKIYGKENLKKHRSELKSGAITVSNHVFMWDFLCVLKAIRPHLTYFPAWKENLEGTNGPLIRMSGGIPIPTDSIKAMKRFNAAMDEVFESGKWMHFYPEGSMWYYYPEIRPLKKAVFQYAVKYDKPLIPITMSFRPRRGIMKLLGKKPLCDLHVGEPLYADKSLPKREAERDLHARTYHIMQVMNGIEPDSPAYRRLEE